MRLKEVRTKRVKPGENIPSVTDLLDKINSGEVNPDDIADDHIHKGLINAFRDHGLLQGHPPQRTPVVTSAAQHEKTAQALFGNVVVDTKKLASLLYADIQLRWRLERLGVISYNRK